MRTRTVAALVSAGMIGGAAAGALSTALAGSGERATAAAVPAGQLFGVLRGANEIGEDGKRRAGDLDGRGSATATYDADTDQLCFGITVKNISTPVAAHIHRGNRRRNGPVVVPLMQPLAGDPGASSGCVDVAESLARAIFKNPRKYYWNVHTTDFQAGAVRGQLFRKKR